MYFITIKHFLKLTLLHIILTISQFIHYNYNGDDMYGIDLNKEIKYHFASLRFFDEREYHVNRVCEDDVLLLVYDGVLRFSEDGVLYEIHPGEYHIQKHGSKQEGVLPSDAPKYLFVHFYTEWTEDSLIAKSGTFDYQYLKNEIEKMNVLSYSDAPYIIKVAQFYTLLSKLCKNRASNNTADKIAKFISENCQQNLSIDMLCKEFCFSKNHIINIFKNSYGQTPIAYLNFMRLKKAEELLITTSDSIESISLLCGYQNYSHFYRQFMRKNKVSPENFRKQKRIG